MYKLPPAAWRRRGGFYPLMLPLSLNEQLPAAPFTPGGIRPARLEDIPAWMDLARQAVWGYPFFCEEDYLERLKGAVRNGEALILRQETAIGILSFRRQTGEISFMAVHPQYPHLEILKLFLMALNSRYLPGQSLSFTTYRSRDQADLGWRRTLLDLGFLEGELLTEYGYPTQRFLLAQEVIHDRQI